MDGRFDVVEDLEAFLSSKNYLDISRLMVHARMTQLAVSKKGEIVPDMMLNHVHDEHLMYLYGILDDAEYEESAEIFDQRVWPEVKERLRVNYGAVQMMLEHGVHSKYIMTCFVDMYEHQGLSIPMGHGIGRNLNGNLEVIPFSDAAMRFMNDPSFSFFRHRTKFSQSYMHKAEEVLMLGGGTAMSLVARNYPLGSQHIVIYDSDADMASYFAQLAETDDFGSLGVEYRVEDFHNAFADPAQKNHYDFVEGLGIAAYNMDDPDEYFGNVREALHKDGITSFDLQVLGENQPTLPFDAVVMGWCSRPGSKQMKTYPSVEAAIEAGEAVCKAHELQIVDMGYEDRPDAAGVVFVAKAV